MDAQNREIMDALRLTPFLGQVPTADLEQLAAHAIRVSTRAGEILFRQGEKSGSFFIVLSGHVVLFLDGEGDPSKIARIAGRGESFGESCICCHAARLVTAQAFGRAELIAIPGAALQGLFCASPGLAVGLISEVSMRLRGLVRQVMDLKMKSAAQRLGGYLLELAAADAGPATIRLPFEKKTPREPARHATGDTLARPVPVARLRRALQSRTRRLLGAGSPSLARILS